MSVFGVNTNSNFNAAQSKRVPKHMNGDIEGLTDNRRTGDKPGKRKVKFSGHANGGFSGSLCSGSGNKYAPKGKKVESPIVVDNILDIPSKTLARQAPEKIQSYTQQEIQCTGPLYHNAQALGFKQSQRQRIPRPVPKYMILQSRLLYTPKFSPNQWDKQNQEKMLQIEQANTGNDFQGIYEEFQKMREHERKQMENLGLVDAENIRKDLNDAILFQGSCEDMCPIFERVRRSLENNVKNLEKDPVTNKISRARAIKAFSRPAAGQPPPLPSEVRPPHILKKTLDYLIDGIIDKLPEAHSFIWDRTRSIRQDFTYQNSFGQEAIDCNERIVRIHLLSLHIMAKSDQEWSQQQELEQFNKALQTLIEIYQDIRNRGGGTSPNEAEFRSYHLLSHLRNPELETEIQNLPNHLFKDPQIQLALKLRHIVSQNNLIHRGGIRNSPGALNLFFEFFKVVYSDETPFLMACLLETHFNEIRFYALKSMSRCYHTKGKAYLAESLKIFLGFDSIDKLLKFVAYYEVDIITENGEVLVDLFNKEKLQTVYKLNSINEKPKLSQPYSTQLDAKIKGKSLKDFINMGRPNIEIDFQDEAKILPPVQNKFTSSLNGLKTLETPNFNVQQSSINESQTKPAVSGFNLSGTTPSITQTSKPVSFEAIKAKNALAQAQAQTKAQLNPTGMINSETQRQSLSNMNSLTFKTTTPTLTLQTIALDNSRPQFMFSNQSQPKARTSLSSIPTLKLFGTMPKIEEIQRESRTPLKVPTPLQETAPQQVLTSEKKSLSDHPGYPQAIQEFVSDLVRSAVDTEITTLLPKLIRYQNVKQERTQVIDSLASELYNAFLAEITYQSSLEVKADWTYKRNLILKVINKLRASGQKAIKQQKVKRSKIEELNSISFKVPHSNKRRMSTSSSANSSTINVVSKRRNFFGSSTTPTQISERQSEIQKLWSPIDTKVFLTGCSQNLSLPIESRDIEIQFLLVVENWTSPYSKWLNTKLSLKADASKKIYEAKVKDDKMTIYFKSLPSNNYLTKDFFAQTSFILFECGLTQLDSKHKGIREKLARDQAILSKIVSLVNKYSHYKVQILIVYWDATETKLESEEVSNLLKLNEYTGNENIQKIALCDMTPEDKNVNDILVSGFNNIQAHFNGALSKRGEKYERKILKLKAINEKQNQVEHKPVVEERTLSDETFKANESLFINKAKRARKYDYLKNHVNSGVPAVGNTSLIGRLFNTTVIGRSNLGPNTSANLTANSSQYILAHNKSIISHLTAVHRNNYSMLSGSSANSSFNNISTLTGFGNGVIEESTPASSPNLKARMNMDKKPLPKSVQQLRDLTAGIKARFKKN